MVRDAKGVHQLQPLLIPLQLPAGHSGGGEAHDMLARDEKGTKTFNTPGEGAPTRRVSRILRPHASGAGPGALTR